MDGSFDRGRAEADKKRVQIEAAKSEAWANIVSFPLNCFDAGISLADKQMTFCAGLIDSSFLGAANYWCAEKICGAEQWVGNKCCEAYEGCINFVQKQLPGTDVRRMIKGVELVTTGIGKIVGGGLLTDASAGISLTGIGAFIGIGGVLTGLSTVASGGSDIAEGIQEIYYGWNGDSTTVSLNWMRDWFYEGNSTAYHLGTGTAASCGFFTKPAAILDAKRERALASKASTASNSAGVTEGGRNVYQELDEVEDLYDDIFEQQRNSCVEYEEYLDELKQLQDKSDVLSNGGIDVIKTNKIPDNNSTIGHIFRDAEGHIPDTPENRTLLENVANNIDNFHGKDMYGNEWYTMNLEDGSQVWVEVRNGNIFEGGINKIPKAWNPNTGLKKQ